MTEKKLLVTFKDEGEEAGVAIGPVRVVDVAGMEEAGGRMTPIGPSFPMRPFGSPEPEFSEYLGWLSKPEAMRIARERGAEFREV
jgi:hypothetical protein